MTKLLPFLFVVMLIFATALFVSGVFGFLDLARHSAPTGLASSSATPAPAIPSEALPLKTPRLCRESFSGRTIDPTWKMPHPVLSELEARAAQSVEAIALRDGFAVRSVTCKQRGAWQLCDLCYSHPERYYGQIRVACNRDRCESALGNDDPRTADLDLNFCETH